MVSGLKVATGPGPKFAPGAAGPAPSPDPGPTGLQSPAAGRTCDEVGVGRRRGRGGDGAVAVRAAREVALAGLQVVGGRPLLQQGLVVHGGRRPPRPARLPPGLPQGLPLPRRLGLARTPGPGGGTRSSRAATAAAGLGPSRRRAPRASPPRLPPPGQSQDPGHVARLPAGVRRGAGPTRRLKGAASGPGHPVGHLSALTPCSSPLTSTAPRPPPREDSAPHTRLQGDAALGSRDLNGPPTPPLPAPGPAPPILERRPLGQVEVRSPEPTHHGEGKGPGAARRRVQEGRVPRPSPGCHRSGAKGPGAPRSERPGIPIRAAARVSGSANSCRKRQGVLLSLACSRSADVHSVGFLLDKLGNFYEL